jgi:hypothetical protein
MNTLEAYTELSPHEKLHCLLCFAHELTILARENYDSSSQGVSQPQRLRTLNEMQHRLLATGIALYEDDPKRYPDEVLLEMLLEHPEDPAFEVQVRQAFDRARSQLALLA